MGEEWFKGTHGHKGVSSTQQAESLIRQAVEQERKRCVDVVRERAADLHRRGRQISEAARLDSLADTIEKGE